MTIYISFEAFDINYTFTIKLSNWQKVELNSLIFIFHALLSKY